MGLIETKVYIDFDNDLDFSDADEDISDYVTGLVIQRGTDQTLNAGSLELQVLDADGRFQPQNTGGPYGSGLMIGRRVQVTMELGDAETLFFTLDVDTLDSEAVLGYSEVSQFYGFITEITPEYVAADEYQPVRSILAADLLCLLNIRKVTTGTLLNKQTGELIELLLDNLGWEGIATFDRIYLDTPTALLGGPGANWRYVDAGQTTIPYCSWEKTPIAVAIRDIVEAEHGLFWIGKDGWVHFEDRHHRSADRVSLATLTDNHISELVLRYTDQDLFNVVEVVAHPRSVGTAASVVFDAIGNNNGHEIEAGASREYPVSYSDPVSGRPCEATGIVTPVSGTDYVANSAANGSGSNRTIDITVSLVADDNGRYTFTVTNNSSSKLYLTKLQLRATPLVAYDAVSQIAEDKASQAQFLERDLVIDNYLLNDPTEANDYADWLLLQYKDPHARIERLTLFDSNWTNALQILNREISDRVTIQSDKYNINGDFFIDGISLETDLVAGQVRCEWMLNNGLALGYAETLSFTLDVDTFTLDVDTLDSEAALGYAETLFFTLDIDTLDSEAVLGY